MQLTDSDKKLLFQVARGSIEAHLKGQSYSAPAAASPILQEPRGVFVTLHRQGQLRGCIGFLEAVRPLLLAVQEMALAAAFQDHRFQPLRPEELADLELEISVLTPMRRLDQVSEIEVGTHGLYIEQGYNRGLLLPQVATEYKWDRETFLQQTCRKAGLAPEAWKDPATRLFVFTADILSEHPGKTGCTK